MAEFSNHINKINKTSDPAARKEAVVINGNARFTVLTPELIRLEYSDKAKFEDRPSIVFINRNLPVPEFEAEIREGNLTIDTGKLLLTYAPDGENFNENNISIIIRETDEKWIPGKKDKGNLGGTIRTLDNVNGPTGLDKGLLSKEGWTLIDDSERPLFDDSEWPWVSERKKETTDWYFFGHGRDYKKALKDFTLVAGKIPLPPRFAFGYWWSRYWAYTDAELMDLVKQFEIFDVPLDVLVIDMDWHLTFGQRWMDRETDQSGYPLGWSGYTWDRTYFPDPDKFLEWTKNKGLKTTLNLHPASGVQPFEEQYEKMAKAMGIDPSTKKYVPFDITNKKFAENYFKILHHPLEDIGIDFWWLDWQQELESPVKNLTHTWWLNYVHFSDMERRGKRPLLFHRWGGLGNHRYQVGFSGDAYSNWKSLAFQPYFTATASNVGYGYWSHDIGGHQPGDVSPELYTRWIQFGVFSPILRTHTTKNPEGERRIWAYTTEHFLTMREAIILRYRMIPYIYTLARYAYEEGISILRPMYYDHPWEEDSYHFPNQYMFGDDILVAPITAPADEINMLSESRFWLPEGEWIEWNTGARLKGPGICLRSYDFSEMPLFAKAGTIIPMQPEMKRSDEFQADPLTLVIFPGADGSFTLYEDEGNTPDYKEGKFSFTKFSHTSGNNQKIVRIGRAEGDYPGKPGKRSYEIKLFMSPPAVDAQIINSAGEKRDVDEIRYDGGSLTSIVKIPFLKTDEEFEIRITIKEVKNWEELSEEFTGKSTRYLKATSLINRLWGEAWSPDDLVEAAQTGRRITLNPEKIVEELTKFEKTGNRALEKIYELKKYDEELVYKTLEYLLPKRPEFTNRHTIFTGAARVEMISQVENAQITYTMDGSEPMKDSLVYKEPVTVTDTTVIKARSYYGGISSPVVEQKFEKVKPLRGVSKGDFYRGLKYTCYSGKWIKLPDIKKFIPKEKGFAGCTELSEIEEAAKYSLIMFEGYIYIPNEDVYEFFLSSDGISRFYVHDRLILDDDNILSREELSKTLPLQKGFHKVELQYFRKQKGEYLELTWRPPDGDKEKIPEELQFYRR